MWTGGYIFSEMNINDYYMILFIRDSKIVNFKAEKWRTATHWLVIGLVMCSLVPSILCNPDRDSLLTYEKIFNNTSYHQLQYQRPKAYHKYQHTNESNRIIDKHNVFEETNHSNELDDVIESTGVLRKNNGLLVGFSHDPYRNSVPEREYINGVRNVKAQYVNKNGERDKRGVIHLYNMIYCATGCDPISYKGYGCYCGFLGAGRSMDGIDRCCKMHDHCYEKLYCPFYTVYFQPYYWKCYHGQPHCALENHQTRNQLINGCAAKLCECDRRFAMCLQRYRCPRGRALCTSSPLRLFQNVLMLSY